MRFMTTMSGTPPKRLVVPDAASAIARIRSPLPRGLEHAVFVYEVLLGRLLLRGGSAAVRRVCTDLASPEVLARAKHEYLAIFAGVLGTVFEMGPRPTIESALSTVWRPAAPDDLPLVLVLWVDVAEWLQRLPPGTLEHLRTSRAAQAGRRRFRRAYVAGAWTEAERLRWYHDVDLAHIARKIEHVLPTARNRQPSATRAVANMRNQRFRRRKRGELSLPAGPGVLLRWKRTGVCEWLRPLRPDFFEDVPRRAASAPRKPRTARSLDRGASRARIQPDRSPRSHAEADAIFPDSLLTELELILEPAFKRHRPRAPREALLGVLVRATSTTDGWKTLPSWLGAKAMTCQRLFTAIEQESLWPEICARVLRHSPSVVLTKPPTRPHCAVPVE